MKNSIIIIVSIMLCWGCNDSADNSPACDSKSVPALKQHLVGNWNVVGSLYGQIGYKTTMEFKNDGTFQAPIDITDQTYIAQENIHGINTWKISKIDSKVMITEGYEKGSTGIQFDYLAENIICDRVDFATTGGRLSFYKDNYKIPAICGADTSKGNIENWLVGKWNYVITPYIGTNPATIRTPKGIVEFKSDFTLTDSNSYGLADAFEYYDIDKIKPIYMWMSVNKVDPLSFVILANNTKSKYYKSTDSGFCQVTYMSCNKIVFSSYQDHTITLNRIL